MFSKGFIIYYKEIFDMHLDCPYNILPAKIASKPIIIPESLSDKIKEVLPKIDKTQKFLSKHPERKARTAAFLQITPEEDIYVNEGWTIKLFVTKNPPVGASLDYREQEQTLYISSNWWPNFNNLYHEIVHALDPKARPGHEGYIQRDPDNYFKDQHGGYYKVPEEIDAVQSAMINKIIEHGNEFGIKNRNKYINQIKEWLKSPDKAPLPPYVGGAGFYTWLKDPKFRKQLLNRIYWAVKQLEQSIIEQTSQMKPMEEIDSMPTETENQLSLLDLLSASTK